MSREDREMNHDRHCSLRDTMKFITDKWSLLVILELGNEKRRFSDLHRHIEGISHKVLTHTLRQLERDGIIKREAFPTVPARVEYNLTNLGYSVVEIIKPIIDWGEQHATAIIGARKVFDEGSKDEGFV